MKVNAKVNRELILKWNGSTEFADLLGESGMTLQEIVDSREIAVSDKVWLFFGSNKILWPDNVSLAMCDVLDPYVERHCQSCGDPEIEDWAERWLAGERVRPCFHGSIGAKVYPWDTVCRAAAMAVGGLRYSACGLIACVADSAKEEYDRQFSIALSYFGLDD